MKNLIFLLAILLISCSKKKEEVKPESKTDSLHVVFIGDSPYTNPDGQIKSRLYLNGGNGTVWNHNIPGYMHVEYHLDTIFKGGQDIQFGARSTFLGGQDLVYGTFKIKIIYQGKILADKSFPNNIQGVYANATLPFIP